jgi:predicted RNA-binding protein with EMAP domain
VNHDTAKDPRILVAHRACVVLQQSLQQKTHVKLSVGKEKLNQMAASAESAVMAAMYSYQPPANVASSETMDELVRTARSMADALAPALSGPGPPPLLQASFRWCLRILAGVPQRLGNSGATLASGVDLIAVAVSNVARSGSLWLTRVSDGTAEHPVVTNIPGVRAGDLRAVAFLPPREVGGKVSEAMFLGDERRSESPGAVLDEAQVDAREAASILHEELSKH